MYITYYAPNEHLFGKFPVDKDAFRTWAYNELESNYPTYTVTVSTEYTGSQVDTDDIANISEIQQYCAKLWLRWYTVNK